jgi:hypothetical protein
MPACSGASNPSAPSTLHGFGYTFSGIITRMYVAITSCGQPGQPACVPVPVDPAIRDRFHVGDPFTITVVIPQVVAQDPARTEVTYSPVSGVARFADYVVEAPASPANYARVRNDFVPAGDTVSFDGLDVYLLDFTSAPPVGAFTLFRVSAGVSYRGGNAWNSNRLPTAIRFPTGSTAPGGIQFQSIEGPIVIGDITSVTVN